jgi:CubicO group peptidase (beta-lactamase class C family)
MVRHGWLVCTALLGACAGDTLADARDLEESGAVTSALTVERGARESEPCWYKLDAQTARNPRKRAKWATIRGLVQDAFDASKEPMSLSVYDADDRLVYAQECGGFKRNVPVAVASASKLVAGMVVFSLISKGELSLTDTTGDVLGFEPPYDNITLEQLLSFTSGLPRHNSCLLNEDLTLEECVNMIGDPDNDPSAAPGELFNYGGTHLQVAGLMAEVRGGMPFNKLFRAHRAAPLQLSEGATFYTLPRELEGTENPLVAGGLRISVNEYASLLGLAFRRGRVGHAQVLIKPTVFQDAARDHFPEADIGNSPLQDLHLPYRYGLASWLECDPALQDPAERPEPCSVISSPGAFGFTPWLDRENEYYAILGMEVAQRQAEVVSFSVNLQQDLKPLIAQAISAE